jgi:tetratricopeptide (TPR) repeat protein
MKGTMMFLIFTAWSITMLKAQNNFSVYFNKGAVSIDNGAYSLGIDYLSKALQFKKDAPGNYRIADAYIYRSLCHSRLENYKAALSDVDHALKLKPEYVKAYAMKSSVLLNSRDFKACLNWADSGLKFQPDYTELLLNKSKACYGLKDYKSSRAILHQVLGQNPRSADALRQLGAGCIREHYWDSAVHYFSKVIEIDPLDAASFYDRGISKSFLNNPDGARADIENGMQLDTSRRHVGYNNLGFFLKLEEKDYQGALGYFDKAIALSPQFGYAYSNRGFAKLKLNDLAGALKDVKKAIALDKDNAYAYKNLGLIHLEKKNKKQACDNFKKALDLGYSSNYDDEVEELMKVHCY